MKNHFELFMLVVFLLVMAIFLNSELILLSLLFATVAIAATVCGIELDQFNSIKESKT